MTDLDIRRAGWDTQAAVYLEPACDEYYTIDDLACDVQEEKLALFNIYEDNHHAASMALRVDDQGHAKELVVVCLGGRVKFGNLIMSLSDFWNDLAVLNGAKSVRAHVFNKAMAKLMERVGGTLSEYVYRKEVSYGR